MSKHTIDLTLPIMSFLLGVTLAIAEHALLRLFLA